MKGLVYALSGVVLLGAVAFLAWRFQSVLHKPAAPSKAQVAEVTPPKAPETPPETPQPVNPSDSTNPAANGIPPLAPLPPETPPAPKKQAVKKTAPNAKSTTAPAPAPITPPPAPTPQPQEKPEEASPAAKAPPPRAVQMVPVMVGDGLPFRMALAEDVPANAPEGTVVHFTVMDDFRVGDKVVIAKGATVTGKVVPPGGKKFLGIGGSKISYELDKVDSVDGRKLNVRALSGRNADGPSLHAFETPNGRKSKGYAALQGTEYIAYTEGDQTVSVHR